jgi:hypothetical protein
MPKHFNKKTIKQIVEYVPSFPVAINKWGEKRLKETYKNQGFRNKTDFINYFITLKDELKQQEQERKDEERRISRNLKQQERRQKNKVNNIVADIFKNVVKTETKRQLQLTRQLRRQKKTQQRFIRANIKQYKKSLLSKGTAILKLTITALVKYRETSQQYSKRLLLAVAQGLTYEQSEETRWVEEVFEKTIDFTFNKVDFPKGLKYINDPDAFIFDEMESWVKNKKEESPIDDIKVQQVQDDFYVSQQNGDLRQIRMRDAFSLMFSGEEHTWDTKKGRCVFDYIIWRYGNIKGFKKVCNYFSLDDIFKNYELINEDYKHKYYIQSDHPLSDGVDTIQITKFCRKFNIPMYALDEDNKVFHSYIPEKRNKDAPSLVYKVLNNHFYPIIDKNEIQSISHKESTKSITFTKEKKDDEKTQEEKLKETIEKLQNANIWENVSNPNDILFNTIIEKQALPKKIKMHENKITEFTYKDDNYIINQDIDAKIKLSELFNLKYAGQSLQSYLIDIMKEIKLTLPLSTPNPYVYDTLNINGIKDRTHYGFTNCYYEERLMKLYNEGKAHCADIAKCHTACLYEPEEEWIVLDFNDTWKEWTDTHNTNEEKPLGLYLIETDDTTLFHGCNIYSSAMLNYADANNIEYKIKKYLQPSHRVSRTFFKPLLDKIKEYFYGKPEFKDTMKLMMNMLSGYLGKTCIKSFDCKINSDISQAWIWINKNAIDEIDTKPFLYKLSNNNGDTIINGKEYYIYGKSVQKQLREHNIPMYIQMKDFSNIRLHQMIKYMGGELAFRKVDCAITVGGNFKPTDEEWGGYRLSSVPKLPSWSNQKERQIITFDDDKEWIKHSINNSSDWEQILKLIEKNEGLLVDGRAGTGKTYAINKIVDKLSRQGKLCLKSAFTNKACLLIKGKTLHKTLKIDNYGRMPIKTLINLRDNIKPDYIFVDEISMIPKNLWKCLCEVKKFVGCKFVLIGDKRQCEPVEAKPYNYFNHSCMKYLVDYNCIELNVMHRYDKQLWDLLEDVMNIDTFFTFKKKLCKKSICYTNKTRKEVNDYFMGLFRGYNNMFLPYFKSIKKEAQFHTPDYNLLGIKEDNKDEPEAGLRDVDYQQNVWIYENLPVISRRTIDEGDVMVSNESFYVKSFNKDEITLISKRFDEDDNEYEHKVVLNTNDFHEYCLVNYCSTVHKNQGDTITEDFTILEWDIMDIKLRYTALSRAKNVNQVHIFETKYL